MKYTSSFRRISRSKRIATVLLTGVIGWTFGLLGFVNTASAVALTNVSDTLSQSAPSVGANHVIAFTSSTTVPAAGTIKIQLDPTTDAFTLGTLAFADMSASGSMTLVSNAGACSGSANEVYPTFDNTAPDINVTLTVCSGDTIPSGAHTVTLGGAKVSNPGSTGSYIIRLSTSAGDSADTRVAIVNYVTVTAAVDTTLTFTISGVAIGSSVNGDATTTATTTTATSIPFGVLASGSPKLAAQDLAVTTNARNGFIVTIIQNQNLLSNTNADIDLFKDGNANVTPIAWTAPAATLGSENTYGHYGVTSEDADLNSDEFGTALYAGNFGTTSRTVFSNNGPSDGLTANIGSTRVGYKIQVSALQEAANDYNNRITYVCTPTF